MWISLLIITSCIGISTSEYSSCNRTFDGQDYQSGDLIPLTMNNSPMDVGKPIMCYLQFTGTETQRVLIHVKSLRVGAYKKDTGCTYGQLKISDETENWDTPNYPPTVLCGYYEKNGEKRINVRRLSSKNTAKVDFWVTQAASTTGFDIEAQFVHDEDGMRGMFGNYHTTVGRIRGTNCDWLVPVDQFCKDRLCSIVSPGWPGIYPPNTKCSYHLTSTIGERVELSLSSRRGGKFDMKRSKDCEDDYVNIYDGNSTSAPKIGTYCGHDAGDFISSGDTLLLVFKSGPGGPPWDYSGFEGHTGPRWLSVPDGGLVTPSGVCDYDIAEHNSTSVDGSLNTPDHNIAPGTACTYKFISFPYHRVLITYTITYMTEGCNEYVEFFEDGVSTGQKKCSNDIEQGRRHEFVYKSNGPNVTMRYVHKTGQISNKSPVYIYYEFRQATSGELRDSVSIILMVTLMVLLYWSS